MVKKSKNYNKRKLIISHVVIINNLLFKFYTKKNKILFTSYRYFTCFTSITIHIFTFFRRIHEILFLINKENNKHFSLIINAQNFFKKTNFLQTLTNHVIVPKIKTVNIDQKKTYIYIFQGKCTSRDLTSKCL